MASPILVLTSRGAVENLTATQAKRDARRRSWAVWILAIVKDRSGLSKSSGTGALGWFDWVDGYGLDGILVVTSWERSSATPLMSLPTQTLTARVTVCLNVTDAD